MRLSSYLQDEEPFLCTRASQGKMSAEADGRSAQLLFFFGGEEAV